MIFGDFPIEAAEGVVLAYSIHLSESIPNGRSIRKGRTLCAGDIAALTAADIHRITGARLEAGDVDENAAADSVADVLVGANVGRSEALTGRSNLLAEAHGLLIINRERIGAFNRIHEGVTVATAEPWMIVEPGQVVATLKIIPFAVERRVIDLCRDFASAGEPAISVRPFIPHKVAMIQTTLAGTRESVLQSAAAANRSRIEALGSVWLSERRCNHDAEALAVEIGRVLDEGCSLLLISGASATVDRRDIVPAAILGAGGGIDHFGMPADPGNLLLLGHVGQVPVIDLPGCARSPSLNGLDLVLRRVLAGLAVTASDIMDMGVGGLLKQCPSLTASTLEQQQEQSSR
ncbi:molybdenum cofactor biosynthesis protein [Paramagnetospirillum caucaseum]|uniref:Molybdenum cofactor biosynthesis protein n=1 Tax=Paramagnetospirillum caucaseum TaxID=1244869 RepID=M2Y892_9PROT|nr:molybdopterin-binding protein [Paramagnetospirillum caucaseum]EME69271.1 molybdenum cofactor biosynthesis protein [Paramagnetospirillum caucaseum]